MPPQRRASRSVPAQRTSSYSALEVLEPVTHRSHDLGKPSGDDDRLLVIGCVGGRSQPGAELWRCAVLQPHPHHDDPIRSPEGTGTAHVFTASSSPPRHRPAIASDSTIWIIAAEGVGRRAGRGSPIPRSAPRAAGVPARSIPREQDGSAPSMPHARCLPPAPLLLPAKPDRLGETPLSGQLPAAELSSPTDSPPLEEITVSIRNDRCQRVPCYRQLR
jgi:hypothetical protein